MKWEPPAFVEINMSAEIGGYQSDFPDRDPRDPVVDRGSDDRQSRRGGAPGAIFTIR